MGTRVQAFASDMTREEHARAVASMEALAEAYLEDMESGAAYSVSFDLKAKGKKGSIPRGTLLFKDAPTVIAALVSEIRRRDQLLDRALDVLRDRQPGESVLIDDIIQMLAPADPEVK